MHREDLFTIRIPVSLRPRTYRHERSLKRDCNLCERSLLIGSWFQSNRRPTICEAPFLQWNRDIWRDPAICTEKTRPCTPNYDCWNAVHVQRLTNCSRIGSEVPNPERIAKDGNGLMERYVGFLNCPANTGTNPERRVVIARYHLSQNSLSFIARVQVHLHRPKRKHSGE